MKKLILSAIYISASLTAYKTLAAAEAGSDCTTLFYNQKEEAFSVCKKFAEDDDPNAQKIIGDMYYWGWGTNIDKDYAKAVEWYLKAAQKGDTEAKYNLGVLYEQGKGVQVDYIRAFKWFMSAAQDGHPAAQFNVANMYSKGAGTDQNQNQAAKWYLHAAEQGDVESQYNMGNRYAMGNGVSEDMVEAYKWYSIAIANGDKEAEFNIKAIESSLTPEQISTAKNLAEKWRPKAESKGF